MTVNKELETKILRYHHVEKWRVGTIASQLGTHHTVVDRVLSQAGFPKIERRVQASMVEPYLPFIMETLKQYPNLPASRLYDMVKERGYPGADRHFRHKVAELRPRPLPEAYLRLKTLPGEQAQVDWGHFGHLQVGKAKRQLMAFVMVLSFSRQIFLRFYLNYQMESFLCGHLGAFEQWQGVPKVLLYDNLKSAVLERKGDAIRFHPTLLDLAAHYRYEPRPVAVARGNEKGRVERAIRYIRSNFFAGRTWSDLDELNAQAQAWCLGVSADRRCPEDASMSVREAFEQERPSLMDLADNPFPAQRIESVSVGKTPYVRFDGNDYSVPHIYVQQSLSVQATQDQVRIFKGEEVVADHPRSWSKAAQIENPEHIKDLVERKRQARRHRGQDRLIQTIPQAQDLLIKAAERGHRLGTLVAHLLELLADHGAHELSSAITEALAQEAPHLSGIRLILQRRREASNAPPALALPLSTAAKARDVKVRPASLQAYDQLNGEVK